MGPGLGLGEGGGAARTTNAGTAATKMRAIAKLTNTTKAVRTRYVDLIAETKPLELGLGYHVSDILVSRLVYAGWSRLAPTIRLGSKKWLGGRHPSGECAA